MPKAMKDRLVEIRDKMGVLAHLSAKDAESAHGKADDLLIEVIEILGKGDDVVDGIIERWNHIERWYG